MVSDITSYLRRNSNSDSAVINKILQDLAEIQPELKGDAKQERIVKINEVYQINQTVSRSQWTDAILLEDGTSYLLTESDSKIYLELNT